MVQGIRARLRDLTPGQATLAVSAIALALCLLHLLWLARFRWGFVGDWDESGYASIALRALEGLNFSGVGTLLEVLKHSFGGQPPLVPLSTVPFIALFGRSLDAALVAELPYFVLLVLATYGLGRRLMSPRWAALAAVAIGTAPVVSDFTRLYSFAVPAAALFTSALFAVLSSDGLRRRGWVLAAGVLLGLTVLARTMTVAYLPAVAVAVAAPIVVTPEERGRRLLNFGLLWVVAAAVAAPWYVPNLATVGGYLTSAGYGPEALNYGASHSPFSLTFWTDEVRLAADELYLPLSLALLACFAATAVVAVRRRTFDWRAAARRWSLSEALLPAVVVFEGYLALSSTPNTGNAFSLPWLPSLVVLAAAAASRVPAPRLRIALALGLVAASTLNLVGKSGISGALDEPRIADVPLLGNVTVLDGRDVNYRGLNAAGYPVDPPPARLPAPYRRWRSFDGEIAGAMIRRADERGKGVFLVPLTGDFMLSDTRIVLAAEVYHRRQILTVGELRGGDSVGFYRTRLGQLGANFVLTADAPPVPRMRVTRANVVRAVRGLGFRSLWTAGAPDGRRVTLWWHDAR